MWQTNKIIKSLIIYSYKDRGASCIDFTFNIVVQKVFPAPVVIHSVVGQRMKSVFGNKPMSFI